MRVIAGKVLVENYPGGPGPAHASPCSGTKTGLKPGKIFYYRGLMGLYGRGLEGVNLAGTVKPYYERSGGGLERGFFIFSLNQVHGGLRFIIYILKTILRGLRAYEAQELN